MMLISRIKNLKIKMNKRYVLIAGIAVIVLVLVFALISKKEQYVIYIKGKEVCSFKDKKTIEKVLAGVAEYYSPEKTKVKAYNFNGALKIKKSWKISKDKAMSTQEAIDYIATEYIPQNDIEVLVSSAKEKTKEFTPEPVYKKSKKMLAGQSKKKSKAIKGKKRVTILYQTKNGEIISKKSTDLEIIDEGKGAIVYKGILGLPEGEEWETYEGDPVFNNGEELATTAKQYIGLRYKLGGTSLKTGVDCVTYVWNIYKLYGIKLGCSHAGLRSAGKAVSLKNAKKGDIVCYYGHVAIYLGNGKIIHASPGKGVHVSKNVNYRKIRTIRRVEKK